MRKSASWLLTACIGVFSASCDQSEHRSQDPTFIVDLNVEGADDSALVEMSWIATEVAREYAGRNNFKFHRWQKTWENLRTWSFTLESDCGQFTFLDWTIEREEDFQLSAYLPWGAESASLAARNCLEAQTNQVALILEQAGFQVRISEYQQPEWMKRILEERELP